ncbi:MAG: cytochrome c biogenesis protein CcsA, partial [Longimicrobiales bacterium]
SSAALYDLSSIAIILLPIVVLLLAGSLLSGLHPSGEPMSFRGPWFTLHVLLAFAAYAGLTLSAAAGLLYLLQFRELKEKHLGRIFRFLPALPTLDAIGRTGLFVAFPCLTLALVLGWSWSLRFGQGLSTEEAQVIWGVITWIVFALIVAIRTTSVPSRERRAASASVIGFVIVILAYLVLRISPVAHGGFL